MLQVQCDACGAQGYTESGDVPDAAVQCGCCSDHGSHDEHVAHVRDHGDASCRPVTITLLPGSARVS